MVECSGWRVLGAMLAIAVLAHARGAHACGGFFCGSPLPIRVELTAALQVDRASR